MFIVAYQDLQELKTIVRTIGYTNNTTYEVETMEAITRLVSVTTTDWSTIASLTQ